jgi:hypothetical protein
MGFVNGVNLLPSTGEFTYGTTARIGQRVTEAALTGVNFYFAGGPPKTDYSYAIDQLQAAFPACTTVAVVCAWFGSSTDAAACQIYPATTYVNNGSITNPATGLPWPTVPNAFEYWNGSSYTADHWRCSSLDETSAGLIPISTTSGSFTYGGTPSDQSIVECISDLKARGFRVVFYPFILMDAPGKPWRGRITYSPDVSSVAASAVAAFLGSATTSQFTRLSNTVSYAGSPTDFTYRRMVLHYANLCIVAGGVDLFLIGSEFRGLETIRGPGWTIAGTTDGGGKAIWDYPFVAGLITLSDDVRSVFDSAGLAKDTAGLHNLISYAADWSSWMGWQHPGANPATGVPSGAQWPHLDQLSAHGNIDLVCFDNYMPLSDWTTGFGSKLPSGQPDNLDIANWGAAAATDTFLDYGLATQSALSMTDYGLAADGLIASSADYGIATAAPAWPPPQATMSDLGLTSTPTLTSKAYLKANIEGGEKFNWFYFDSENLGRGNDPLGSDLQVSLPAADRLAQTRTQYFPQQQILGNKQIRWWWNNAHFALYDNNDGFGEIPHGPATEWIAQAKPVVFTEYGYPACDKCTNQPNVFFDPKSTESFTPFWSAWRNADGGGFLPKPDQNLQLLALQAFYEYWFTEGHNAVSSAGIKMIEPAFCSVWNWDARPFPAFPNLSGVWSDAGNWQAGNWLSGKGPFLTPSVPDPPFVPGPYPAFPVLRGIGWSVHYRPGFTTGTHEHVSGRGSRFARTAAAVWEIELVVDLLTMDVVQDFQTLAGFYEMSKGQDLPFTFPVDPALGIGSPVNCRFADDSEDLEQFMNRLWHAGSLKLRTVKE